MYPHYVATPTKPHRFASLSIAMYLTLLSTCAWSQSQSEVEQAGAANQANDSSANGGIQRPIEQISVRTERTIMSIRFQLREAEENMFGQFNDLNSNDEFDIKCRSVRRANSHIPNRECEPRFLTRERQANSIQVIAQMRDGGAPTGGGLSGGEVAGTSGLGVATGLDLDAIETYQQGDGEIKSILGQKYVAMNNEIFKTASESPEFLQALLRVEEFREDLEEARNERWSRE